MDPSGNLGDDNIVVKEEYKEEDEEYGVMKELSEGHKDLYKDIIMEPSSNLNPPERCPRPLYSRDSTLEDHNYALHDQSGNHRDYNIDVKEEYKKEDELFEGHNDLYKDIMMEPPRSNPPERCPRPLDSTQEGHTIPHHHQGEDLMTIKVEGEVEETYVRDDQQYTEEAGMRRTFIEEDTPTEISTGHAMEKPSKDRLTLSPGCRMEDEDITGDCGGEKAMISTMDGGLHSVELHSCSECGKYLLHKSELIRHQSSHTGKKSHSCPECGKCLQSKGKLDIHYRSHTGEKPYSCPECGKRFSAKSSLCTHRRSHTGEKPYSCPECGKCFARMGCLQQHQRSHTGEKPYPCPQCGKCFSRKGNLAEHQATHRRKKTVFLPVVREMLATEIRTYQPSEISLEGKNIFLL
ncbi:uncharacterized protein LOC143955373 [Lithobates pipiens]